MTDALETVNSIVDIAKPESGGAFCGQTRPMNTTLNTMVCRACRIGFFSNYIHACPVLMHNQTLELHKRMGHRCAMRLFPLSLVVLFVLAACDNSLSTYYRPGVSVNRLNTDTTRCEVKALQDAPIANQVRQRPPIYIPGQRYCTASGCYYGPGYWVGGGYYTVDLNQGLRGRVMELCMAQKGYQPVQFPRCSSAVSKAAPATPTRTLPKISENSCAIKYDDGSWQIVTPQAPIASE